MTTHSLIQRVRRWQPSFVTITAMRFVLYAAIILSMLSAGWKLWASSSLRAEFLAWPLALAIVVATTHRIVNAYGWTLVLWAMRLGVNGFAATQVWLMAESRRWLPGGVWGYASRASMASRLGINPVTATASMLLELLLVLFASAIVAVAGVIVYGEHLEMNRTLLQRRDVAAVGVGALLALALLCWFLRHQVYAKLRILQARYKSLQSMQFSIAGGSVAAVFFIAMNLLGGLVTVVLTRAIPGGESVPILAVLAAASAAWCVGFFAVLAPGGLLVREAALAAMLVPWLPYTDGLALAVLTRLAQLVAEAFVISLLAFANTGATRTRVMLGRQQLAWADET